MSVPVSELCGPIRALLMDMDGTLTTRGQLESTTLSLLEQLIARGIPCAIVTGRPAGWGHALINLLPLCGVITENGAVSFYRRDQRIERVSWLTGPATRELRSEMHTAIAEVQQTQPQLALSTDSRYREVDLALDWNEDAQVDKDQADAAAAFLRQAGFAALRSSVHVNFGPTGCDKAVASKQMLRDVLGYTDTEGCVFVGDSLNDAPMFSAFAQSVGVANLAKVAEALPCPPRFMTCHEEGAGVRELLRRLLELVEKSA